MGGSADLRDCNQAPVLAFSLLRIEAGREGMVPEKSRKVKQAANGEDMPVETGIEWQATVKQRDILPECRRKITGAFYSQPDRKRVVSGKSVSIRVDLGGSRLIKKKKQQE